MGQTLDKPVTDKDTHVGQNEYLYYGVSCMQGFRVSMEDRHNTNLSIDVPDSIKPWVQKNNTSLCFFGVYDGHSGDGCAEYLSKNLQRSVLQTLEKYKDESKNVFYDDEIIKSGFINTDEEFANKLGGNDSGCTATTSIIRKTGPEYEIICANTGDSRTILFNGKITEALSRDHKPYLEEEKRRIKEAGGYIEFGRVNGTLAVSRAFGDLVYKENSHLDLRKQAVTALPDVTRAIIPVNKRPDDLSRFIVLACDGVWDVMKNEEVSAFITQRIQEQKDGTYWHLKRDRLEKTEPQLAYKVQKPKDCPYDLGSISEDLLDHVVLDLDSKDNVSVVIVLFKD